MHFIQELSVICYCNHPESFRNKLHLPASLMIIDRPLSIYSLYHASEPSLIYAERAQKHPNPVTKKLFEISASKQSNLVISADLTTTKELLKLAGCMQLPLSNRCRIPELGPYVAVLKTHMDIVSDFDDETVSGPQTPVQKAQLPNLRGS